MKIKRKAKNKGKKIRKRKARVMKEHLRINKKR
jgi:hypothetical protein